MRNYYSFFLSFIIIISFSGTSLKLYADAIDFDCDDLYGCVQKTHTTAKNTSSSRSPNKNNQHKTQNQNMGKNTKANGSFMVSGNGIPAFGKKQNGFLYSVVFLSAMFDNGVQKQGYGILLKDGYTLAAADLMNEEGAYLRSVVAKIQDDSSKSLMCFAMLRLRATDSKLSLLRAENYTDIYCNTRDESFYHQRVNLYYFTPIYTDVLKNTVLSKKDSVLFPFITEKNSLHYKSSSIANIQKHSAVHGLPLFNTGGSFVGFLYTTDNPAQRNSIISSDEVRDFVCMVAKKKLLPTSDLTRACEQDKVPLQ